MAILSNTAKQAIEDMYVTQKEIKELLEEEGKQQILECLHQIAKELQTAVI